MGPIIGYLSARHDCAPDGMQRFLGQFVIYSLGGSDKPLPQAPRTYSFPSVPRRGMNHHVLFYVWQYV